MWCECKKHHICEKHYIWNPPTCSYKNGKYLASIIDNLLIRCDEITDEETKSYDEEAKTVTTSFNEKNAVCILLAILLTAIALLAVVLFTATR